MINGSRLNLALIGWTHVLWRSSRAHRMSLRKKDRTSCAIALVCLGLLASPAVSQTYQCDISQASDSGVVLADSLICSNSFVDAVVELTCLNPPDCPVGPSQSYLLSAPVDYARTDDCGAGDGCNQATSYRMVVVSDADDPLTNRMILHFRQDFATGWACTESIEDLELLTFEMLLNTGQGSFSFTIRAGISEGTGRELVYDPVEQAFIAEWDDSEYRIKVTVALVPGDCSSICTDGFALGDFDVSVMPRANQDCSCDGAWEAGSLCTVLNDALEWWKQCASCTELSPAVLANLLRVWIDDCESVEACLGDLTDPTCTDCCDLYAELEFDGTPVDPELIDEALTLAGLVECARIRGEQQPEECPGEEGGLRGSAAVEDCADDCDDTETPDSVNYATGQKSETEVDLLVSLPGEDYHFVRRYTSGEPGTNAYGNMNGWLGSAWHVSSIPFLREASVSDKAQAPLNMSIIKGGDATHTYSLPVGWDRATESLPFRYEANGATGRWLELADLDGGTGDLDVRLYIEGVGEQVFQPLGDFFVLSYEVDLYGNETHYNWTTTTGGKLRPDEIYLDGPAGSAHTTLKLTWADDTAYVDEAGSPMTAILLRADVYRGSTANSDNITQFAEYTYTAEDSATQAFGLLKSNGSFSSTGVSTDLGGAGELVQVVTGRRTNVPVAGSPLYAKRVMQYRYYTDTETLTVTEDQNNYDFRGAPRRLKLVLSPEQIEFIAQDERAGQSGSPDEDTVVDYATTILGVGDNDASLGGSVPLRSPAEIASKIIGYDPDDANRNNPVSLQFLKGDCACSGAAAGTRELEYTYYTWGDYWHGTAVPGRTMRLIESIPGQSGRLRTTYFDVMKLAGGPDDAPYLVNKAVTFTTPDNEFLELVTRYEYDGFDSPVDDGNRPFKLEAKLWPSTAVDYRTARDGRAPEVDSAPAGYVEQYTYDDFGFKTETWVTSGYEPRVDLLDHTVADVALIETRSYADTGGVRRLASISRYQDADSVAADTVETSLFTYAVPDPMGVGEPVTYVSTTGEAELSMENGPGGDFVSYDFFDETTGNLIWSRAADGGMTNRQYDAETGALTRTVRFTVRPATAGPSGIYAAFDPGAYSVPNWASDPLWNSAAAPADYDRIDHLVDDQGRSVGTSHFGMGATTSADTYIIRDLAEDPLRPGILYPRMVVLPDLLDRAGTGTPYNPDDPTDFAGPARVTWMNASGSVTRRSDYELDPALAHATYGVAGDPAPFTFGPEIAREAVTHDLHGVVVQIHRWPHLDIDVDGDGTIDGASKDDAYTTAFEYDNLGYLTRTEHPNGTVVEQERDKIGRVWERRVGTTAETPVAVAIYEFDNGLEGDSNVTSITRPVDNVLASDRVKTMQYDVRNRIISVVRPDDSDQAFRYDNLDRVVEEALYETLPAIADDAPLLASGTDRGFYRSCEYGQRGLKTREFRLINPLDTTLLTKSLVTNYWYDGVGRLAATRAPDSATEMTIFDGLGRITRAASVAEVPVSHASATGVLAGAERVLEQVDFSFDQRNRVESRTALYRLHSDTSTGAFLTSAGAVPDYGWSFYDDANRLIASIELGTNNSGFIKGGALPARPTDLEDLDPSSIASIEAAVDEVIGQGGDWLAAIYKHNSRGLVEDTIRPRDALLTDPLDAKTFIARALYDDLSRPIATVENAESVTESSLVWRVPAGSLVGRWQLSLASVPANDVDRVTSFVYDGSDNMTIRSAHTAAGTGPSATGEEAQVTRYVYGASAASSTPGSATPRGSWVASNDLLAMTIYPDETTGEPGATLSEIAASQNLEYVFQNGYNKQGELIGVTDQNQTKRTQERDQAGRLLEDSVNSAGAGVDTTVIHRRFTYDGMGRMESASSVNLFNTVLNSVGFEYTGLWSVATLTQNHDGDLTSPTGPEEVVYKYPAIADASASNTNRVLAIQYPSDASLSTPVDTVTYGYGAGGTISDLIGRIETITNLGKQLASYTHAGASLPVIVDYSDIRVALAHDLDPTTGAASADGYPSLDRHGRTVNHAWISYAASDDPSDAMRTVYPGSAAARKYSYDLLSNRLSKLDGRDSHIEDRDWWFDYDGLNRLTQARTGINESAGAPTAAPGSRDWTLDVLGNWQTVQTDIDGDWVFGGGAGQTIRTYDRTHNNANEIDTVTESFISGGLPQIDPTMSFEYDANGNMLSDGPLNVASDGIDPFVFNYDAWNRIVSATREIDELGVGVTSYVVGEYEYNALHWRTRRLADTSSLLPSDARDQERLYYWSADWQLLEERISTDTSDPLDGTFDAFYKSHQIWGKRYLDDAIAKRIDRANDAFDVGDSLLFYLTDAQFSPIALIEANHASRPIGAIERLDFSPYGTARHRNAMDTVDTSATPALNFPDGILGLADLTFFVADHQQSPPSEPETDIAIPFGLWDLADLTASDRFNDGYVAPVDGWLTNPSTGTTVSTDNSIGFTGHIFDFETGLYSARHRHYSPELGRWLQRDPIGYKDSMNLFELLKGNSIERTDPLGLDSEVRTWASAAKDWVRRQADSAAAVAGAPIRSFQVYTAETAVGRVIDAAADLGAAAEMGVRSAAARSPIPEVQDWGNRGDLQQFLDRAVLDPAGTYLALEQGVADYCSDAKQAFRTGDLEAIGDLANDFSQVPLALTGVGSGPSLLRATSFGDELVTVTRWGRPGLEGGDFVMRGGPSRLNYLLSGKGQPGISNNRAAFDSAEVFRVPANTLRSGSQAGSAGLLDKVFAPLKYPLGQRSYRPDLVGE